MGYRGLVHNRAWAQVTDWLVVRTHNRRETWAAENIVRQGAEPYLPRIAERIRYWRSMQIERPKSLFPSYLFVKATGQWRFLLSTFGVIGVVMQGGGPARMPQQAIDAMREREGTDGLIRLPKRLRYAIGETVKVANGAFSGYTGIYLGAAPHERERILLEFLGHRIPVLIGHEKLQRN